MQTNINIIQAMTGYGSEKPLAIFAKLFALIPAIIPIVKKIYPEKILINFDYLTNLPLLHL